MSKVGDGISAPNARWSFEGAVSDTFDEHVSRSVPFYREGHDLVAKLSDYFLASGSLCYDIGCSTGTLIHNLAVRHEGRGARFVGIDVVPNMLDRARKKCDAFDNVTFEQGNLLEVDLEPSDLIVSYYTIQFVRPMNRQLLYDRLFNALNWGGALIVFEKVRGSDARFQDILSGLYVDYKLEQDYSPDEIVGKSRSLKGVLEPFSTQGNLDLMSRAGFQDVMSVFKYVCFEGFLAIK